MRKFILLSLLLFPVLAFAEVPSVPVEGFEWVTSVTTFLLGVLAGIPGVGGVVATVFSVIGVVAAVMTALSLMAQTVLAIPQLGAHWAGKQGLADKIKSWSDKIIPWLQYFSAFNVQKKK